MNEGAIRGGSLLILWLGMMFSIVSNIINTKHPHYFVPAMFMCSFAFMLYALVDNFLQRAGRFMCGTGCLCNALVIAANYSSMPCAGTMKIVDGYHSVASSSTRLLFLCDIIPWKSYMIFSLGDLLILSGLVLWFTGWARSYKNK